MTIVATEIADRALSLSPVDRAELIDKLLSSFDAPSATAEKWAVEAESRLDAYERGDLSATPAKEVYARLGVD